MHGRDQSAVTADESPVFDHGCVLVDSIVVAGDGAGADVDPCADFGIAQIGEMVGFGSLAQLDLLGLDKIANVRTLSNIAAGAQMGIRAEDSVAFDAGAIENAAVADEDSIADFGISNHGIRPNAATGAYVRVAQNLNKRLEHGVRRNLNVTIDDAA